MPLIYQKGCNSEINERTEGYYQTDAGKYNAGNGHPGLLIHRILWLDAAKHDAENREEGARYTAATASEQTEDAEHKGGDCVAC